MCLHVATLVTECLLFISAGYAFLLFRDEVSVHRLIKNCVVDKGKLFMFVSSVTESNKKARPWPSARIYFSLSPL